MGGTSERGTKRALRYRAWAGRALQIQFPDLCPCDMAALGCVAASGVERGDSVCPAGADRRPD